MGSITETLSVIAEYSIGLAGFAGIVAALSHVMSVQAELQEFRFINLLVTAFAPGLMSIFTMGLINSGLSEVECVRVASALLLTYMASWALWVVRSTPGKASILLSSLMWCLALANIGLQIANVVRPDINLRGFFVFGLLLLLIQGTISFITLALTIIRSRAAGSSQQT